LLLNTLFLVFVSLKNSCEFPTDNAQEKIPTSSTFFRLFTDFVEYELWLQMKCLCNKIYLRINKYFMVLYVAIYSTYGSRTEKIVVCMVTFAKCKTNIWRLKIAPNQKNNHICFIFGWKFIIWIEINQLIFFTI
jgi:hypothetical protein